MFDFSKVGQLGAGAPAGKFPIILNHLISIAERNRQTGEKVEQKKACWRKLFKLGSGDNFGKKFSGVHTLITCKSGRRSWLHVVVVEGSVHRLVNLLEFEEWREKKHF